jgi:predicted amidohydrolase YtcJ
MWAASGADFILTNGHVYTADPKLRWAEAVAVKGSKIVYVGSNADAKAEGGPKTREVDLGGRLLLPGLFDTHNHVNGRARELFWANLGNRFSPHTLESYRQSIQEYRAKYPNLKQVRGRGFDGWILPAIGQSRKRQPRQLLDDIVSDVPAYIQSWTGHSGWANTKALELAGITKDTPDPPDVGATIERDPATGEPNGILNENGAMNLVVYKLPEPDLTVEQYRAGILSFQREIAPPRGITSILVPTDSRAENLDTAMQQLSDEGLLTLHISAAQWVENQLGVQQVPELVAGRARFHGGRYFTFNVIKLSAPWPQEPLNQTIAALDKQGFQVYVHQTGSTQDYAAVLDAFEYTIRQNGPIAESRHIITHMRATSAPLAARFKALGVRADADWNKATDWYLAPKAFIEAGVPLTLSSDYPIHEMSPLAKIAECVKHGVPIEALIDSVTIRGAEAQFIEKETGSITVGKAADLVVFDKDLFRIAPPEIEGAKVLLTVFAGKELYRDPAF